MNLIDNKEIIIDPILDENEQYLPTHVDLRLDTRFRIYKKTHHECLSISDDDYIYDENLTEEKFKLKEKEPKYNTQQIFSKVLEISIFNGKLVLHPGQLVLGQTFEYIKLPYNIMGLLDGRSSFGRMGVLVHATASSIDPGFQGHITFEFINMGEIPVILYPLQRLGRITFYKFSEKVGTYQGRFNFKFSPEIKNIYSDSDLRHYIFRLNKIKNLEEKKKEKNKINFENYYKESEK